MKILMKLICKGYIMKLFPGKYPEKLNFTLEGQIKTLFMCSNLNFNRKNLDFLDFLSTDIGSQIFREKMLSIHIETCNIFYDNYNTGESIYNFY